MKSNHGSRTKASADVEKGKIIVSVDQVSEFGTLPRPRPWKSFLRKVHSQMEVSVVGRKRAWLVRIAVAVMIIGIFAAIAGL